MGRGPTVLGVVERTLDVVLVGTDVNRPAMLGAGTHTRAGFKVRQLGESEIDFHRSRIVVDVPDIPGKLRRQEVFVHQLVEGYVGIRPGHDELRRVLASALHHNSCRAPFADRDALHRGAQKHLTAEILIGSRETFR